LKGVGENIDFGSTILSRFDLIFVMKDEHNVQRDIIMARHVIGVHQSASGRTEEAAIEGEMNIGLMKKFIAYCRQYIYAHQIHDGYHNCGVESAFQDYRPWPQTSSWPTMSAFVRGCRNWRRPVPSVAASPSPFGILKRAND
jgi:DNA replicative helicase MCM subunit Mcm2 (Cdc46/Mcm family)